MSIKMSKPQVYTINVVNKKILAKAPRVHAEHEYLGPQIKYRDEEYEIYKGKRQEFYEAAKNYEEQNKTALLNRKDKLDMLSNDVLRYYSECECEDQPRSMRCTDDANASGLLLRKRSSRRIHEDNNLKPTVCSLEPWFKRYLKLCKFIYAARTIILKNRLLKNLEILRKLNKKTVAAYEKGHIKYENVSYADIFQKFIKH